MFKVSAVKCKVITTDALEDGGETMPWGTGREREATWVKSKEEAAWRSGITGAKISTAENEQRQRGNINLQWGFLSDLRWNKTKKCGKKKKKNLVVRKVCSLCGGIINEICIFCGKGKTVVAQTVSPSELCWQKKWRRVFDSSSHHPK